MRCIVVNSLALLALAGILGGTFYLAGYVDGARAATDKLYDNALAARKRHASVEPARIGDFELMS